jgi:hypothetical protein
MFPRALLSCRLVLTFGAAALLIVPAHAQLASRSPFMPPQSAAPAGPAAGAPLEYRALMGTGEGLQFRIFDPAKKVGAWVKLNEKNSDFDIVAKQYDEEHNTLTLEHQGKTLTLALRESKVVSSGNAAQAMPPPPQPVPSNVPPAVTQAVVLNPTPADEQRRLEAVAAEVARRRALREQATQSVNQGNSQPVAAPQPMQPQVQQPRPMPPQGAANTPRPAVPQNRQQR